MPSLFCIGLGYSAEAYIGAFGGRFDRIAGTVRSPDKQKRLAAQSIDGRPVDVLLLDSAPSPDVTAALASSDALLVSAPPANLANVARAALAGQSNPQINSVVYLSSVSVYGDHNGAEVDEDGALQPHSERGNDRIAAEMAWQDFSRTTRIPVAIFRLAGIYGPGRNALVNIVRGEARRIVKPNQVFNRIHVADIAQAIDAAFEKRANGIFNLADDEPSPPQDVIAYAAELMGQPTPPAISFEDAKASMSPMARSFYADNKRIVSRKIKSELGLTLRYPDYRRGLSALAEAGDHEHGSA